VSKDRSFAAVAEQFKILAASGGKAVIVIRDYMTAAMQNEIGSIGFDIKIVIIGQQREFKRAGTLPGYGADRPIRAPGRGHPSG
jgi:putative ABC transport system substrate-binding protein